MVKVATLQSAIALFEQDPVELSEATFEFECSRCRLQTRVTGKNLHWVFQQTNGESLCTNCHKMTTGFWSEYVPI